MKISISGLLLFFVFFVAGCGGGGTSGVGTSHMVSTTAGAGGSIDPASQTVVHGGSATFIVTPDTGYLIGSASGCNGSLEDEVYTTGPITQNCEVTAAFSAAIGGYGEAPRRVVLVAATSSQGDQAQLDWLATLDNDTPTSDILYRLHADTSPTFIPSDATVRGEVVGGISGILSELMPSTLYHVKVEARDFYGNRSWSNELSVVTAAGVPVETADPRRVLDADTVSNLTVMENEIRYELPRGQSAPEPGELLVSPLGEGFLRRATSVTQQETEVVVGTEPAALNEVFEDLQFSFEIQLIDVPAEPEGMRLSTMTASPDHQTRLRSWPDSGLTLIQADPVTSDELMVMAQAVSTQDVIECDGISGRRTPQYDSPLRVSFPEEVCVEPGSDLSVDISAEIEPGFEAQYQVTQLFLKEITHPKVTKIEPLFGAEWVPNALGSDTQGKGTLLWTPQERHVDSQLRPYTAQFVALAKEREGQCTGILGLRCQTRKVEFEVEIGVTWGDLPTPKAHPIRAASGAISVDGSAAVNFQPTIRANADIRGTSLHSAELVVAGPIEFKNTIRVHATADAGVVDPPPRLRLDDKRFIKIFLVGGVPIVVNGHLKLDLEVRANVDAALDLSKVLNIGYEIETGLQYRDKAWHVLQKAEPWHRFELSGEADTNAYAELRFVPDLEVSFYDYVTGRLILEPFLYGQAGLDGHFVYRVSADGSGVEQGLDADYRFTDLQFGGGIDGRFRVGLEALVGSKERDWLGYPSRDPSVFHEFALIDRTPILGLPTLRPAQTEIRNPLDCRAIGLAASVEPVPNPFHSWLGGPETFNNFVNESADWEVVLPNGTEVIYPGTAPLDAWFNADVSGQYTVRFSGHSSLGSFVRQYESVVVDFDATADDCGYHLTPVAGMACEAHGMCGITFSLGEGADPATTTISLHWGDGTSWDPQSLAECVAQGHCKDLGDGNYRIWKAYGEPGSYSAVLEFWLGDSISYALGPVLLEPAAAVGLFPLTAAPGNAQATLTWAQLGADRHNLCQAGETIVDIDQCGVYQDGAWSLNVGGPPLAVQGLENDQTYHFRLEAIFGNSALVSTAVTVAPIILEKVLFVSEVGGAWDIFSVGLDGSDLVNLTEATANDRLPAASPSLSKIAFVSDRDGPNDIYVMNMDGSDVERLTHHRLDDAFPVWSPDGSKIAFISQLGSGGATYDIYVMDSDGENVVRLTDSRRNDTQPHWSPDGDSIVFVSERDGAADIFLMKADGSDQTNLTKTSATDTIPFFSPDGSRIAFVSDRDGDFDLWIMDVDGRNLVKLTSDGTDAVGWYSWSPDGKLIAFDSMENGVYDIYVVDPLTKIIRQVTDSTASDRFASWTWFGSKIAYLSDEDGAYTINVVDPDGQGLVRLFEGAVGEVFLPAASPVYEEGGGCFIATAAYGSYLEPRVAKLREFRDDYLLATSLGKVFVSHYYMWSPPIADVIRQHESLRVIMRAILTPIVFGVQYPMQSSLILFVVGFVLVKRSRRESSRIGKQEHLKAR